MGQTGFPFGFYNCSGMIRDLQMVTNEGRNEETDIRG